MEMIKLDTPNCVSSLRLFGSAIRSELDEWSDIDVLAVYSQLPSNEQRRKLFEELERAYGPTVEVAEYHERRLREFFTTGHLFAWHLTSESTSISTRSDLFFSTLPRPAPYEAAAEDAMQFQALSAGVFESLQQGTPSLVFDMGVLYVACRNFSLCISAMRGQAPIFSRYSPFLVEQTAVFPLSRAQYDFLIACRKASTKGMPCLGASESEARLIAEKVVNWMARCLKEPQ